MVDKVQIAMSQENLKSGKSIPLLDENDIEYMIRPIGKAIYKNSIEKKNQKPFGRPKKNEHEKAHYSDKIKCDICGGTFVRSHRADHRKTKVHQAYEKMNRKLSKVILDI